MRCHVCNAEVGENQKFCHECGESLIGVTDPTEALDMSAVFEQADADGSSVDGVLPWADDLDDESDDATVAAGVGSLPDAGADATVAGGVGSLAGVPDAPVIGEVASPGVADQVAASSAISVDRPTQAVKFGDDAPVDLWETPTGEQPAAATPDVAPPPPPLVVDPDATATMGATPLPADSVAAAEATTTIDAIPAGVGTTTDEFAAHPGGEITGQMPGVYDGYGDAEVLVAPPEGPRFRLTLVLGVLAVLTAVLASFADITDVRTDRVVPGIENRLRTLDDIGSNLAIAAYLGAGVLLIGGVLHCFNQRWGAGLAGGAGLALGGWASVTIGLAEVPIATAERITRDPNTPGPFLLTVTRDLGFWLVIAIGVLGGLAFLVSLVSAGTGGRRGLDPWTAAVGALGGVIAAAGPLIPVDRADFSSNFGVNDLPLAFFAGRLVQVVALGIAVMLGFLLVRRYGLGLVGGALSVPTFMWVTSLTGVGAAPIGLGVGNLGTADITPHAVTTVGIVLALAMLAIATTIAVVRRDY